MISKKKQPAMRTPAKKTKAMAIKAKVPAFNEDAFARAVAGDASAVVPIDGADVQSRPKYWISTRNLSLDKALGGKGLPGGRIIEVMGPESSGRRPVHSRGAEHGRACDSRRQRARA